MTIEQKALELDLIARVIAAYHTTRMIEDAHKHCHASPHVREAIDRLIASMAESDKSRHAAELREQAERFSEAAALTLRMLAPYKLAFDEAEDILSPFILAPVDPLVEAVQDWWDADGYNDVANLRAALEARGLAIVKKEAVNG